MKIYCCNCESDVKARLTGGFEIYPHRHDLSNLPFWKCDDCNQFVGCHHKTDKPTQPLGVIPSPQIKKMRKQIHSLLDPIWKTKRMRRGDVYKSLSRIHNRVYHTAEIRSVQEAEDIIQAVKDIRISVGLITF